MHSLHSIKGFKYSLMQFFDHGNLDVPGVAKVVPPKGGLPQVSVNPSPRLLFLLRERCRHSPPPFTLPCHRTKPPKRLLLLRRRRSNSPQKRRRRRKKESVALNGREPRSVHLPVCCTHSQQGGGWRRPTYIARRERKK